MSNTVNRRDFVRTVAVTGGVFHSMRAIAARSPARVLGANDRINIGVIGVGGRGEYLARTFAEIGERTNGCQVVAVCDVWERRRREVSERMKCKGALDYHEIIDSQEIDAVVIATPDHWHGKMALEAVDRGKDVYLEKPMCHTIDEAKHLAAAVRESKRILQVGSQTTSFDQWHKARNAIADGMIGQIVMSQGSFHRNSVEGEWGWKIDPDAGPNGKGDNYIDWRTWLGPAPERPFDADRFFRYRRYWDYSGGIATDLLYHVVAPLNICWSEPQFPRRVMASGGNYIFKNIEVPDTFNLLADYGQGHSLVVSSTVANSKHIPGLIRGHSGSLVLVEHGMFERKTDYITVIPELGVVDAAYKSRFGENEIKIPVEVKPEWAHMQNFLDCIRSRQKPVLDAEAGFRVQTVVTMAVRSYREGCTLFWDDKNLKVVLRPPRA